MPFLVAVVATVAAAWTLTILAIDAARGNRVTLLAWAAGLVVILVWAVAIGVTLGMDEFRLR